MARSQRTCGDRRERGGQSLERLALDRRAGRGERLYHDADDRLRPAANRTNLGRGGAHPREDGFFQRRGWVAEEAAGQHERIGGAVQPYLARRRQREVSQGGAMLADDAQRHRVPRVGFI